MNGIATLFRRFGRFNLVGALGTVLQLAILAVLTKGFGLSSVASTPIAVELVLLHNFLWHERFTWNDRRADGTASPVIRLWRFHAANGVVSLCGNTLLMYCLVERLRLPMGPSALGAISLCALVNFRVADRWVYASGSSAR